jgi:hypothetical protein
MKAPFLLLLAALPAFGCVRAVTDVTPVKAGRFYQTTATCSGYGCNDFAVQRCDLQAGALTCRDLQIVETK